MIDEGLAADLLTLSREIHADPELAYEERRAAERIAVFLERRGHRVERKFGGLETAFRARIGPAGPSVALLAEYAHRQALVAVDVLASAALRFATDASLRARLAQ